MKRYEILTGGKTYMYIADEHYINREINTITILDKGKIVCQAGLQGLILQIRDEQYLEQEKNQMYENAKYQMENFDRWQKEKEKYTIKYWFNKIFH
jgi:ABC-type multidrug transport system ATPase subunit